MDGRCFLKSLNYLRDNRDDIGVLILFFALSFTRSFINLTILGIILYSIYTNFKGRKFPSIRVHWFSSLLFIYFLLSVIVSEGTWSLIERRLTLLFIPLVFALNLNYFSIRLRSKIYLSFVSGTMISTVICLIIALKRSIYFIDGKFKFDAKVLKDTEYDFMTSSVMGGNYFFSNELSYFLDPTYFALYIVVAQVLLIELFISITDMFGRRALAIAYIFLFLPLFLLSSKAALISSVFVLFYGMLRIGRTRKHRLTYLAIMCIITFFIFFYNPRLQVFINTISDTLFVIDPSAKYGHSLRMLSWDASITLIQDNWVIGVGEGYKEEKLQEMYLSKGYAEPAREMHNTHNQYLDFLLGGGIVGLGIFLVGIILLTISSLKSKNYTLAMFILIFSFAALFENLFTRYSGNLLFSSFITLLVGRPKETLISLGIK
jgi:O-antigen ligase